MTGTRGTTITTCALALVISLASCSGEASDDPARTSSSLEPSESVISEPQASTATSAAAAAPSAAAFTELDVTDALRTANAGYAWVDQVVLARQTEAERLVVETSIVDPRGESGSPEAQSAIKVCEAAVSLLADGGALAPKVSVMEADGTTYVLYGHPAYPDGCTEV